MAALSEAVTPHTGLRLMASWWIPTRFDPRQWVMGKNIFTHPDDNGFTEAFLKECKAKPLPATGMLALGSNLPFIRLEKMKEIGRRDGWITDLLAEYGFADVLYCPCRAWTTAWTSDQPIKLSLLDQMEISKVSQVAVGMLARIYPQRVHRKSTHQLSAQQIDALQLLARGVPIAEATKQLGINRKTFDTQIARAVKKLHARDRLHAIAEAFRLELIG